MFFKVEPLFPGLTRIWDVAHTAMYLAEGTRRAVLIDSGVGVGDLKGLVDSLTDKPVTVLMTHGHVDHAMGAVQFEDVRMNPRDRELYERHSQLQVRRGYVARSGPKGADAAAVTDEDFLPARAFEDFAPLAPGDRLDLGGVTVEVMNGKGHTPGCLTFLFPEWRLLLLGDACNDFTFLFDEFSSPVAVYREMLLDLKAATDGCYDRTLFSHGKGESAVDMIDRVITVCDEILERQTDDMPFPWGDKKVYAIAKAMDLKRFGRVDGGAGNVVYNPERLG